ncbi:MAG TPA: hypothetical protein PKM06_09105 [Bacillota bacterium]|jgi:hypothetical protein|nr:hypothetical protein [Peptococcaceae bacterium MAG4]NLW38294.1 hypothetical protein [Peptococcaceae bacterium]HQD77150.1 hypothetical protein [Bacillota bacterium]HUM59368.1 hypothetical protein [Bacillota bacterium]
MTHSWMGKLKNLLLIELRQIHMMAHLAMLAPNETARHMVLNLIGDELDEAKFYNSVLCTECSAQMPVCPGAGFQPDLPCPPGVAPGMGHHPDLPCPPHYPDLPCPPHHDPCPKPVHPPGYLKPARPDATLAPSVPVEAPGLFPGLYPGAPPGIPLAEKENKDENKD